MTDYLKVHQRLFKLNFSVPSRMSIEPVKELYCALNLPLIPMIHVAGTNGKGSCVKKVSSALTGSGYRCATFTSPHVGTFRERISIDGKMISENESAVYASKILSLADSYKTEVSFFEVLTLMAFHYFSDQKVDVAVIEVGLGGRLDATNCITPILSVITSIGFDHEKILGDSLEKIAFEKAGIIKRGVPVILGPTATQESIKKKALTEQSKIIRVPGEDYRGYELENRAIAQCVLNALKESFNLKDVAVQNALLMNLPCRFQKLKFLNRDFVLDMSHNADGINRFKEELDNEYPGRSVRVFTSMSLHHNYEKNLKSLQKITPHVEVLDIQHERLMSSETLLDALGLDHALKLSETLEKIKSLDPSVLIVFIGSIFIMKDVLKMLGQDVESDELPIVDGNFKSSSFCGSK